MKILYKPSREEVIEERKRRYLEKWPIENQLEAYSEALSGRPEKQEQMIKDFTNIRNILSFPKGEMQCLKA